MNAAERFIYLRARLGRSAGPIQKPAGQHVAANPGLARKPRKRDLSPPTGRLVDAALAPLVDVDRHVYQWMRKPDEPEAVERERPRRGEHWLNRIAGKWRR